jgi:predicted MFS family arabinose efflux permease
VPTSSTSVGPEVRRARTAVVIAFAANGLAFAAFISRTPVIRDSLGLSSAQFGLLLLCLSGGAVSGLPLSGPIVHRWGPAWAVLLGAFGVSVGLGLLVVGLLTGAVLPAAVGLALNGMGTGVWDVAMNVEGAAVEQRLGRSLMPRLHAAFSLGTVAGAGIGAASAATGVPLTAQVIAVAAVVPVLAVIVTRRFLPRVVEPSGAGTSTGSGALRAWREPRTLAIGLMVLAFAFTEGSANDWIALTFVDGYGASETTGAVAFGFFVGAMTIGRLVGGTALERFGRVTMLRVTALLALAGLLLVLLGGSITVALCGALLWGVGASLGFPVGMSAAADDPRLAAVRVSVVSSIGYCAFLAGPPLIGLLAHHGTILRALFVVIGALLLGLACSGAARPLPPGADPEPATRSGEITGTAGPSGG